MAPSESRTAVARLPQLEALNSTSAVVTVQYSESRLASDIAWTSSALRSVPFQSVRAKNPAPGNWGSHRDNQRRASGERPSTHAQPALIPSPHTTRRFLTRRRIDDTLDVDQAPQR